MWQRKCNSTYSSAEPNTISFACFEISYNGVEALRRKRSTVSITYLVAFFLLSFPFFASHFAQLISFRWCSLWLETLLSCVKRAERKCWLRLLNLGELCSERNGTNARFSWNNSAATLLRSTQTFGFGYSISENHILVKRDVVDFIYMAHNANAHVIFSLRVCQNSLLSRDVLFSSQMAPTYVWCEAIDRRRPTHLFSLPLVPRPLRVIVPPWRI